MKKIVTIFLSIVLSINFCSVFGTEYVSITINGEETEFEAPARIIDSTTMVPMRQLFERLGAKVNWYGEYNLVTATKKSSIMSMKIGSKTLLLQDIFSDKNDIKSLDIAPCFIENKTFVPLRAVSECFGAKVNWDNATKTAHIIID